MPIEDEKAPTAEHLARRHYEIETGITQIFRLKDSVEVEVQQASPVKLLEVNQNTVPSGIMPIQFDPAPRSGINYPSVIIEVTPEEFEKLRTSELTLPAGWTIDYQIPRQDTGGE